MPLLLREPHTTQNLSCTCVTFHTETNGALPEGTVTRPHVQNQLDKLAAHLIKQVDGSLRRLIIELLGLLRQCAGKVHHIAVPRFMQDLGP